MNNAVVYVTSFAFLKRIFMFLQFAPSASTVTCACRKHSLAAVKDANGPTSRSSHLISTYFSHTFYIFCFGWNSLNWKLSMDVMAVGFLCWGSKCDGSSTVGRRSWCKRWHGRLSVATKERTEVSCRKRQARHAYIDLHRLVDWIELKKWMRGNNELVVHV